MAEEAKTPVEPEKASPAEEEKAPEAAAASDEKAAAAPTASGENGEKGKGRKQQREEQQVPIEELFDLSKPIPRVLRPSKEEHEVDLAKIGAEIDELKEQRRKIQSKVDSTMSSNRNSAAGGQKEVLSKLRAKKGALIDEKRAIRARLDDAKAKTEKLSQQRKDTKSSVRFSSVADINKEIAALQKRQETTSMSLAAEKNLLKEIEQLQASKHAVNDLKSKETSLEGAHAARKAIGAEIGAKDKEIDAVQKEIDEKQAILRSTQEKDSGSRDVLKGIFAERDAIKKKMDDKFGERNELRQTFRDANNAWYNNQRAVRAQNQIKYEEEKKRRDEERAEWQKQKEEEEAKKIPYEEEMALCEYLAEYLTRTYLRDPEEQKRKQQEELEKKKAAEIVAVKKEDDPFANFKPVGKKSDDMFLQVGKGKKKKRDRSSAKKKKEETATFVLSVDSFEQYGLINLSPPTKLEEVEKSVEELKAKKKWYSEQPRGSVKTAQDIRKSREKAAQKLRQSVDSEGAKKGGGSKKGFTVSSDDFAPLGSGAGASSLNASWGQKPADGTGGDDKPEKDAPAEEAA